MERKKTRFPGLYRRGDSFQFRVTVDGTRSWITVPGGDVGVMEAERYRVKFLGRTSLISGTKTLFLPYAQEWLEQRDLKPRTRELYELQVNTHLKPLHRKRLNEVTTRDVRSLIFQRTQAGASSSAVRNMLVSLSSIFSTAVADGIVDHHPVKSLEHGARPANRRAKKIMLEPDQIQGLLRVPGQWGVYIALGLLAGMRQSEALGLRWEDVRWSDGVIVIQRQLGRDREATSLKGRHDESRQRVVELSGTLAGILRDHQVKSQAVGGYVLRTYTGAPQQHRRASEAFSRICRYNRLPSGFTYHQLRHNYASLLVAGGEQIVKVSRQLGHSRVSTTVDIYTHELDRHTGSSANLIDKAVTV